MRCWRRVDQNAVHIGEPFSMTLTCRIVESELGRAVPDLVGLEPETLDVPPFEVLDGERFTDVADGPRRLFQYQYSLRLLGEDYFGRDVAIPALEINYRIERRLESGAALPGRELVYVLPPESIRVLSLVPAGMPDILALPIGTLGVAEQRRFRADMAMLLATGLGIVAVGVLLVGLVRARRARVVPEEDRSQPIAETAVVRAALGELTATRNAFQTTGWTSELKERALSALRLSAAVALQRPIAERPAGVGDAPRAGELRVRHGLLRARTTMVSSPVTSDDVVAPGLEPLRQTLDAFSAARYASDDGSVPSERLAEALEDGIALTRPLRVHASKPVRRLNALLASARSRWSGMWAP
jgi:hypothetical protein